MEPLRLHLNESFQGALYYVSGQVSSAVMASAVHENRRVMEVLAGGLGIVVTIALQAAHMRLTAS